MRIETLQNLGPGDTKFLEDYWFYLGALNQVVIRWQETKTDVTAINDKATAFIDRKDFLVKFLDDGNSIREADLVTTKVRHLLHSLIMIEDANSYQFGSHLEYMMRAHTWKSKMRELVDEVSCYVIGNQPRFREMLRGIEHTTIFIDDGFEEHVASLDPLDV